MYVAVEELPEFPGGNAGLQTWIINNRKILQSKNKVSGKAEVTFVVTNRGQGH